MHRLICLLALAGMTAPALAETPEERAERLVRAHVLIDGHIDVPIRQYSQWADVTGAVEGRDYDDPRARAGGLDVPFMSIYTPASFEAEGRSRQAAHVLIDQVEALVARAPDRYTMVTTADEAVAAHRDGKIGLALGMENGSPIDGDLANVRAFYDRGIRYITLAHSESNHLSDSSYDDNRRWGGLSPFGREVVAEMNRLGIMVDVSHLSDDAFRQVLEITRAPVIASHSSARHFTPGFERNMSDEMIVSLAGNGGVIMINFGSSFLTEAAREWYDRRDTARDAWLASEGHDEHSAEARDFTRIFRETNPFPFASVSDVADHVDHVVELVGVDHVGLGSDYDGVGDSLPVGLKDVSTYPALVAELLRRGYADEDIVKILGGNLLRAWRAVEAAAG